MIISLFIPFVLAKQRKTYLTDFILENKTKNKGFSNSLESDDISYEATAYGLEILAYYELFETKGLFGNIKTNINITEFQSKLKDKLDDLIKCPICQETSSILYNLYYNVRALDLLNYTFSKAIVNDIKSFLDSTEQAGGGFAPTNTSTSPSLISTYFAIKIYPIIGKSIPNKATHKQWIKDCKNSDGGYGGNTTLSSTLSNTYYAVLAVNILGKLSDLSDRSKTVDYIESFYIDDESDLNNFGGYLPDKNAKYAQISSTYYSIRVISLLDESELNNDTTTQWLLDRQNFKDGGFYELSDASEQKVSSVTSSYFAFQALKIFDDDLKVLNVKIWKVEFNWIILIIVISAIAIAITAFIVLWRKRRV